MNSPHSGYVSPFSERYASREMQAIFSADKKFTTWRRLWVALARAEKQQGLPITDAQIEQLEAHVDDVNYDVALQREQEVRHDVMAHVYAYGVQCPLAKPIIHLGATSCYVGDNTDIIIMRDALLLVRSKLLGAIANLARFAREYRELPALAYTHLQPAQLTTVGKRAALWLQDLVMDVEDVDHRLAGLKLLGSKGTTGTQASFLALFEGDDAKVLEVERLIAQEMGFDSVMPVSGQTYTRKVDSQVLSTLSQIAQSAAKFSNDLRLLQGFKEMEEPFEKHQIGSSAMPYKRNPMRSERIAALARYVMAGSLNAPLTTAAQWFERTLDDSANRRLAIAEGFLAVDGILDILNNVTSGLVVRPRVIHQRVMAELPFMATENIMMQAVQNGGDRQELHERIRTHSLAAGERVKEEDGVNDLLDRICADPAFNLNRKQVDAIMDPALFTGRSAAQVVDYLDQVVQPLLEQNAGCIAGEIELRV